MATDTSMRMDLAPAGAAPAGHRQNAGAPALGPAGPRRERRWVHGPAVDFLLLGGGSFLVLGAMAAFFPRDEASRVALAGVMLFLAHFVNHPHFAHSYQIFYRDFLRKAFGPSRRDVHPRAAGEATRPAGREAPLPPAEGSGAREERGSASEPAPDSASDSAPASTPASLAARYRFAGILVPVVLVVFFAAALAEGSVALLGLAANIMFFTVGWHYAKQGYGILMLDASRKGLRFGPAERRRLLWNTHLAWVTNWLVVNDALKADEFWGITWYLIDVPDALLVAMVALVAVSTLAVGRDLFATWRTQRALPLNGLLAYVAAVYVWLAVGRLDPVLLLVVPFFHSLQYLAVVWRYQINVEADRCGAGPRARGEGTDSGAGGDAEPGRPTHAGGAATGSLSEAIHAPHARAASAAADAAHPGDAGEVPRPGTFHIGGSAGGAHAGGGGERRWKAWLRSAPAGLARFLVAGGLLGFAGFWLAPVTADTLSGYDRAVFGATLCLFIGWDVHQHPPLLHRQRDLAPRQPRGAPVSVREWTEMSAPATTIASGTGAFPRPAGAAPAGDVAQAAHPDRAGHFAPAGGGSAADLLPAPPGRGAGREGPASRRRETAPPERRRHVHNGWIDFLTLGGGSLVVLGALAAFWPRDDAARAVLASTALVLAFFLTYPHVAHSYQLFYKDFMRKAFSPESALAPRYRLAGVLVPAAMVVFFAVALAGGQPRAARASPAT